MKSLVTISLMVISLNSMASSEVQLKNCLQKTLTASSLELNRSEKPSDVLKSMNQSIKSCKDEVKSLVKAEKKAKQKNSLLDKLAKMQEKLKSLN
jgi:Zn-dependent oligopeptidase